MKNIDNLDIENKIIYLSLDELFYLKENIKVLKEDGFLKLKNSIIENGFKRIFPVWFCEDDRKYYLISGEKTKDVLLTLKLEGYNIPEKYQCFPLLFKNKKEAVNFSLIEDSTYGTYVLKELKMFIIKYELKPNNFSLPYIKYKFNNLADIKDSDEENFIENIDIENIEKNKHNIKFGDILKLNDHILICGDSKNKIFIEKIKEFLNNKNFFVYTDPPYGMKLDMSYFEKNKNKKDYYNNETVLGDGKDFDKELIHTILNNFNNAKDIFIWGYDYLGDIIPPLRNGGSTIIWDKKFGIEEVDFKLSEFEICWSKNKRQKLVARCQWFGMIGNNKEPIQNRIHPTQKPIKLFAWFLEKFQLEEKFVVDLYLGSGTTLVGADIYNKICLGIEYEIKYCNAIIEHYIAYCEKYNKNYKIEIIDKIKI